MITSLRTLTGRPYSYLSNIELREYENRGRRYHLRVTRDTKQMYDIIEPTPLSTFDSDVMLDWEHEDTYLRELNADIDTALHTITQTPVIPLG